MGSGFGKKLILQPPKVMQNRNISDAGWSNSRCKGLDHVAKVEIGVVLLESKSENGNDCHSTALSTQPKVS